MASSIRWIIKYNNRAVERMLASEFKTRWHQMAFTATAYSLSFHSLHHQSVLRRKWNFRNSLTPLMYPNTRRIKRCATCQHRSAPRPSASHDNDWLQANTFPDRKEDRWGALRSKAARSYPQPVSHASLGGCTGGIECQKSENIEASFSVPEVYFGPGSFAE